MGCLKIKKEVFFSLILVGDNEINVLNVVEYQTKFKTFSTSNLSIAKKKSLPRTKYDVEGKARQARI